MRTKKAVTKTKRQSNSRSKVLAEGLAPKTLEDARQRIAAANSPEARAYFKRALLLESTVQDVILGIDRVGADIASAGTKAVGEIDLGGHTYQVQVRVTRDPEEVLAE